MKLFKRKNDKEVNNKMARLPSEREDFEQPYRYDNVPKLIDRSPPVENSRDPAREFVRDIKENLRDARETQQPKQTGQVTKEEVGDIIEGHLIRAMELLKVYRSLD